MPAGFRVPASNTGGASNFSELAGTAAVNQGGTGATTASGARTNLGAQEAAAILGALATLDYGAANKFLKMNSGADGLEWGDPSVAAPLYLNGLLQLQNGAENADISVDGDGNLLIAPQNYTDYTRVESFFSIYYHYFRQYPLGDMWVHQNMLANKGWSWYDNAGALVAELGYGTAAKARFKVPLRLDYSAAPASASATGVAGTVAWDSGYFYLCIATDTWQRFAHATW